MGLISKFLASKWVTVALMLALAGGAFYVYQQGKIVGTAKEKIEAYEVTIAQQHAANERLVKEANKRQAALTKQSEALKILKQNTRLQQLAVMEARKNADKALKQCLDMRIADGMRFGPSRENGSGEDQARSDVDG